MIAACLGRRAEPVTSGQRAISLTGWTDASNRGCYKGAGSPDGHSKLIKTGRRMVSETKLTPETDDRNRPLPNRTAGDTPPPPRSLRKYESGPQGPLVISILISWCRRRESRFRLLATYCNQGTCSDPPNNHAAHGHFHLGLFQIVTVTSIPEKWAHVLARC
jgi:hypothetical protein